MYINLFLNNKLVDVNEDTEIKIKKEFQDPEELIIKEITYSYEMELPTTLRNKRVIGFVDAVDVRQKFNRVYDAELYANDMLILRGKFIINEIDKENYKGNIYIPQKKELKDVLGDRTLRELIPHYKYINDWDDITKINNYVGNIKGYGAEYPPVNQRDKHICFPYVLYNWPYNKPEANMGKYEQSTVYKNTSFDLNNVLPAFNVLSVMKDVFATNGYNLIGNVFENPKFTELFQSYSSNWDLYKSEKHTPYYLSFHCEGGLRKYSTQKKRLNTSSSAEEFQDDKFKYCADVPLYSDNATISNVVNKYEMMKTSTDTSFSKEAKTIIVPVSGWYQVNFKGNIKLPDKGRCDRENPVTVTGWESRDDRTDFVRSAYEVQIKRGVPKENPRYYCFNFGLPMVPVDYTENETSPSVLYDDPTAVKILAGESCRYFGKNQKTTLVKNLSGFDTDDFICGARFGHQSLHKSKSCRCEYREYDKMAMMSLYDVSKTPKFKDMGEDNSGEYLILHYGSDTGNTYGRNTAQVMVRDDSYSNFEGYNLLKRTANGDNITYSWDTTSNFNAHTYEGQKNSTIKCTSSTSGTFDIHTCVWLEEGDTIYPEIISAYNHQQDKCSWINTGCKCSGRKHLYKRGCTNYLYNFDFEMGLVSTDENWIPNKKEPILNGSELSSKRYTDVNKLLPEIKCNDYLNNFLQTFNCRLSQIDKNTYSMDYISTKEESGKVISIDDYCNNVDAVFKRITLPSTIALKWKNDTSEEGYVRGNDSPYCEDASRPFNQPKHNGEISFENPANTSGSINKKDSIWSYCWYKSIKTDGNYTFPSPIIADSSIFDEEYTYELAQAEQFKTDYTMRFFYLYNRKDIVNNNLIPRMNYIEIKGDKTFRLLIVDNQLWTYQRNNNGSLTEKKLIMLDYDNTSDNTYEGRDKTITDMFFNINMDDYYQVDIDMIIPNHIFNQIKSNTKILYNDGLWSVIEIDGHSVQEDEPATLSLKSL